MMEPILKQANFKTSLHANRSTAIVIDFLRTPAQSIEVLIFLGGG